MSPEMIHLYDLKGKNVVVTDILRATSCMVSGLANGVKSIKPVMTLEECQSLRSKGYIGAAERNGAKVEGFEIGNSPYSYMEASVKGKSVAVTTTNGTVAIEKSKEAERVIIGAFLNLSAVVEYLKNLPEDLLIVCAGWKGRVNLEDTLYAGALAESLKDEFESDSDAVLMSRDLWLDAQNNLLEYVKQSSHVQRLKRLNIEKDIDFCLSKDVFDIVPLLDGEELKVLN